MTQEMIPRIERWILISAALLVCLWVVVGLFPTPERRYYSQFRGGHLIGLTKEEVVERVGKPTGIFEGMEAWNYQRGRNPGVVLLFTDGKVVEVSEWRRW